MIDTKSVAVASDGVVLAPDDLDQSLAYNADGSLNYIEVVFRGTTYRQKYTYNAGQLVGISRWVKQ